MPYLPKMLMRIANKIRNPFSPKAFNSLFNGFDPRHRHHVPTLTLIELGWEFSFLYLMYFQYFRSI